MSYFAMAGYETFAQFYDAVNGEPRERILQILNAISTHRPDANSVLELGCGTGAVLAGLGSGLSLTGIDLSREMLAYARRRCPGARFLEGDIISFSLDETFDVIVCVYDTLNHVMTFDGWLSVFDNVRRHLNRGGLFIFDVNTIGRLRDLGEMVPWVHDFDGHTLIMDVTFDDESVSMWDIRIFEHRSNDEFTLHHERIPELAVPLVRVRAALAPYFDVLEERDTDGRVATDESVRAFFVLQLKAA
ncbi:MAG: class I SAM-dependent methyltransferase [Acidobacteria bacterium]|nr:class I SAM-dependent methyltransferase [Acidobacteriota bacterium]